MPTYWGDLHNHCAVSYGQGTARRALANAREHLDFCSITGHAFWPDMPMDLATQDRIIAMHLGGFAKLQHYWDDLINALNDANKPGEFVTFPSYEWHSMEFGDHNCYVSADSLPLIDGPDPATLQQRLKEAGQDPMLLPHHIGYRQGFRGLNWSSFDPGRSPLVEIYSNHGSSEADDSPYEYHHSMGPRVGGSMARQALAAGHRFGFYASTDSHSGYPGHYGHGRVGVMAEKLDRSSLWEALRARRTIASTGANITGEITLDDAGIGATIHRRSKMALNIRIEGAATLDTIELIEGGGGNWSIRQLPLGIRGTDVRDGRHKIRIEMGWGRGTDRSEWQVTAQVENGRLLSTTPYFRSSEHTNKEQQPTDRLLSADDHAAEWTCRAIPNPAGAMGGTHFNAGGTQNVVLEIDGSKETVLHIDSGKEEMRIPLRDLLARSFAEYAAGFGSAALKVHRAMPEGEFTYRFQENFEPVSAKHDFLYLRARQSDGQVAWFSPIWYE